MGTNREMKTLVVRYVPIDVWSRKDSTTLLRYRCFRTEPEGRYCVQSMDSVRHPFSQSDLDMLEENYLELLVEEAPDQRSETYPSLTEAIDSHDKEFEDFWD